MYNRDLMENALGYCGCEYVSDTAAHIPPTNGYFFALQTLTDSVFSAITPAPTGNTFTGQTVPAGTILYGQFTSVKLTSGSLIAYKAV